jgi:hypothetical protein
MPLPSKRFCSYGVSQPPPDDVRQEAPAGGPPRTVRQHPAPLPGDDPRPLRGLIRPKSGSCPAGKKGNNPFLDPLGQSLRRPRRPIRCRSIGQQFLKFDSHCSLPYSLRAICGNKTAVQQRLIEPGYAIQGIPEQLRVRGSAKADQTSADKLNSRRRRGRTGRSPTASRTSRETVEVSRSRTRDSRPISSETKGVGSCATNPAIARNALTCCPSFILQMRASPVLPMFGV